MNSYIHKVNYYETDKMGITHHSNYIRWMEEARIYMMEQIGFGYDKLEMLGIGSPVLGYECNIKCSTTFADNVEILTKIKEYNSVKLIVEYEMNLDGKLVATGKTKHCFVNLEGKPIRLSKECIELDTQLKKYIEE